MTTDSSQRCHRIGSWLVGLQFGLLLALAGLAGPSLIHGRVPWGSVGLALVSVLLAAWTLGHNRLGNFNIRPAPKVDGVLVTSGPYRAIRHPMYSAVLLGALALAAMAELRWSLPLWTALVWVLWVKARLEERWLGERYASYSIYCKHSKRFVPGLF